MHRISKIVILTGIVLALLVPTLVVQAQEQYKLQGDTWEKQKDLDPATPEGKLQTIRRLLAQDKPKEARKLAGKWIKEYPNHPQLVEAYELSADARVAQHHYYKALFEYEYVIRNYPASEQFETALEREYQIALLFTSGMKRRVWGMRILPAYADGEEIFIRIQERTPGSSLGEKASLSLPDYYFAQSHMSQAAIVYDMFLQNYPTSEHREGVLLRLIQASLARFKGPEFDSRGLLEAAQRIKQYQQLYPAAAERIGADAILVRIDESLAMKAYKTAQWFEERGKKVSAVVLYQRVIRDHAQTAAAHDALERLQKLGELAVVPQNDAQVQIKPESSTPTATPANADTSKQKTDAAVKGQQSVDTTNAKPATEEKSK